MATQFTPVPLLFSGAVSRGRFEIVAGTDWNDAAQLVEPVLSGGAAIDQAIDLTGTRQRLEIRPTYDYPRLIHPTASVDTGSGGILIEDAPTALVQIFVPGGVTALWPRGEWVFTWTLLKAGEARPVLRGTFVIR